MDMWVLRPFNGLFWALFAGAVILLAVASAILRRKSEQTRRRVLIVASFLTMLGFFTYKGLLSVDREYAAIYRFNWWGELPLHLCNVNMILLPIAVYWNKRPLMSFCFFVGVLGAAMAICMPGTGFDNYSLLLPRMLGYFGTHYAVMLEGLALVTFGLYWPRFRDLAMTALALLLIALAAFGINMVLRGTGLYPRANYFYTVEPEGNAIFETLYRWIPAPYLYVLPCIVILGAWMCVVMAVITALEWIGKRRAG